MVYVYFTTIEIMLKIYIRVVTVLPVYQVI